MSKDKNPRRVADNEAMAVSRMLRTSPQKLNLVAQMIRNKPVEKALADLTFSKKRVSEHVKKTLQSAIANAENNHGLDVDPKYFSYPLVPYGSKYAVVRLEDGVSTNAAFYVAPVSSLAGPIPKGC